MFINLDSIGQRMPLKIKQIIIQFIINVFQNALSGDLPKIKV